MAGQLAPQFTLSDGRRSDDVVGYRYCLLTTPALASTFSPARQAELARGQVNVLIDRADALKSWLREHDVEAVVRQVQLPDDLRPKAPLSATPTWRHSFPNSDAACRTSR